MTDNKTRPTSTSVGDFLQTVSDKRRAEALQLISIMQKLSGETPVMWGPSIIGFGSQHYRYDTGREGDMPQLGFSPRKANITIYFAEGFDRYGDLLIELGKHKTSVSCLYISKLSDINLAVLNALLLESFQLASQPQPKPKTVAEYIAKIPAQARPKFDHLRELVQAELSGAQEVLSYGVIGYKIDNKRARVFISGWKDHLAIYPIPKNPALRAQLAPYIKGKGTLWFPLDEPLPNELIKMTVQAHIQDRAV